MSGRKSDTVIVLMKSVKTDGGKGCTHSNFGRFYIMQTKES